MAKNSSWIKNKQVKAIRLSDGKCRLFDTVKEASDKLGVSEYYIKHSAEDPKHYSNQPPKEIYTTRGEIRKGIPIPLFRFEYVVDHVVTLVPTFDVDGVVPPTERPHSHLKAIQILGVSSSTYYEYRKRKAESIRDKQGRLWLIEYKE
jgi:hypothetical protein